MVAVAEITGGQAVSLSSSQHLVDVILGSTQEELALEILMDQFEHDKKAAMVRMPSHRKVCDSDSWNKHGLYVLHVS